jgi:hypothetical protein
MTFVSQAQTRQWALDMVGYIRANFRTKSANLPRRTYDLAVGFYDGPQATVRFYPLAGGLHVYVNVSKSNGDLFGANVQDFRRTVWHDRTYSFRIVITDQTSMERVKKEVKLLLALHMYRSHETCLVRA